MADPIKSVLLVDYESLQRSVAGTADDVRLAEKAGAWLAALENGALGPNVRRTFRVRRCYVAAATKNKPRELMSAAGFDVVDVSDAGTRGADLHMAMDTMDALSKSEIYQEFVLLSAAAELAPLITRLKGQKRVTVIYADAATPASDRSLADAIIEAADFARALNGGQAPVAPNAPSAPPANGGRGDIEAFARRIHAATSIPLFSPKTFAELFRHLTEEITANGYHFQTTARNVADRMAASGRNVTRRQVVFIVKGLALKGHVFSTTDTAEKLAEVFREQARYLINNAGISLTAHEEDLLNAWFQSRPPSAAAAGPATTAAQPATPPAPAMPEPPAEAKATIAETIEREVAKAVTASRPAQPPGEKIKPPRPQVPPPATAQKPPSVKAVDLPKSTATKPQPLPSAREEAKAVIAARIAGAARMKPAGTRTPIPAKPAPKAPPPPAPPESAPEPPAAEAALPPAAGANAEALESSILAAIAEAVDVLVEDSAEEEAPPAPPERPQREPQQAKKRGNSHAAPRQPEPPAPPPPPPEAEDDAESNDIGDQIQRIIASYNRNRNDE